MNFITEFSRSILVLIGLIALAAVMKKRGVLKTEHASVLAKIVTDVTLPAVIFSSLALQKIRLAQMAQPLVFAAAILVCIALSWWIGSLMKLGRAQKGAFILVSSFGSSAFLGYPVIGTVFPGDSAAIADAVITGEFSVGLCIFTLGVMIAMYFGDKGLRAREGVAAFLHFLRSPIMIALVAGMFVAVASPNKDAFFFQLLMDFTRTLGAANIVFVVFTVGVMLELREVRSLFPLVIFVCILKLILKPILVAIPADLLGFPLMWKKVLVIESAMPTSTLAVVFAGRYGCDGGLASRLFMVTIVCSMLTMIGVAAFLL